MKKKKSIEFLENSSIEKIDKLLEIVNSTDNSVDNIIYENMVKTIYLYSDCIDKYYFETYAMRIFLENYINVTSKILVKHKNKITELQQINKFIDLYVNENLNYKFSIIQEFSKNRFIEERSYFEYFSVNPFKKLLQVLSPSFKDGSVNDPAEIYKNSKMNSIQQKAKRIVDCIIDLNKKSEIICQQSVIKPTTSIMEVISFLPDIIVDNEDDFKKLIDGLYKLFWDNNQKIRNYAKKQELNFINSLRKYFFHDLDHGKESDVRKKFIAVKEVYVSGCGKSIPSCAKDWQKIQEYIYDKLILFLDNIELEEKILITS